MERAEGEVGFKAYFKKKGKGRAKGTHYYNI